MKYQGKVTHWNDEKGFGFVEPNGGGDRAFVHIKAFRQRARRPVNGDVIQYALVRDHSHRFKAENVTFAYSNDGKKRNKKPIKDNAMFSTVFTLVICAVIIFSVLMGTLHPLVAVSYAVMSVLTFVSYAIDKSAAQKGRWRTKESTLHLFSVLGGWPGALLAQIKLRHKSSKIEFKRAFRLTVVINLIALFWFHTQAGSDVINSLINALTQTG
jgi:uncharacterized membrane protein YsdA (DUF1294 family)/cold shock CspA family protein